MIEQLGPIDLHIVAVQRYPELLEHSHEKGFSAYLVKQDGSYVLSEEPGGEDTIKGIFFVSWILISTAVYSKSLEMAKPSI